LARADGQRPGGRAGHRPDRLENLRRNAGQHDLGVLGVGDQAAAQDLAGAGHPRQGGGEQPGGQRLGGGDALVANRQVRHQPARVVSQ